MQDLLPPTAHAATQPTHRAATLAAFAALAAAPVAASPAALAATPIALTRARPPAAAAPLAAAATVRWAHRRVKRRRFAAPGRAVEADDRRAEPWE